MSLASRWPPWDAGARPQDLGRYVARESVRALIDLSQAAGEAPSAVVEAVWGGLRGRGVAYAWAQEGSGSSGQWVRSPGEVLGYPRSGTCLDLALVLAG